MIAARRDPPKPEWVSTLRDNTPLARIDPRTGKDTNYRHEVVYEAMVAIGASANALAFN
jgi:hypothetical protein